MAAPRVYGDFHNADSRGCLRLNCVGTIEDLAAQKITLSEGQRLTLYADDVNDTGHLDELQVDGIVTYSEEEHCWVATIDWAAIHHASDKAHAATNGTNASPAVSAASDLVVPKNDV